MEEICCKTGISQATYYNWKKKYGGLMPHWMVEVSGTLGHWGVIC